MAFIWNEEKMMIDCFAEFAKYLNADRVELNAAKIDKKKYLWIEEVNKRITSEV